MAGRLPDSRKAYYMEKKQNVIEEHILEHLYELLSQDQFELLPPFHTNKLRLVYLMNDAVESFLVFDKARLIGKYDAEYEGELDVQLRKEDGRYVLIVRQGENVCTIFFQDLSMEVHLYNYGKLGHVWVKGHEELRQIEYWIAILRDKLIYLGEEYGNALEKKLAYLSGFPPLGACSYPAVPRKYFEPGEDAWIAQREGVEVMMELAGEAGDERLLKALREYAQNSSRGKTKAIARLLKRNAHSKVINLLIEKIRQASGEYPDRRFAEEAIFAKVKEKAKRRKAALEAEGKRVLVLSQEPFEIAKDEMEYKVHLVIMSQGLRNRRVTIETFQ